MVTARLWQGHVAVPRPTGPGPPCACAAGRDLGSVLRLRGGDGQRLFGWRRHGCRVAWEVATALNYLHSKGGPMGTAWALGKRIGGGLKWACRPQMLGWALQGGGR